MSKELSGGFIISKRFAVIESSKGSTKEYFRGSLIWSN